MASGDLYAFDVSAHALPAEARPAASHRDEWGEWATLDVPRAALVHPMAVGFDDALARRQPPESVVEAASDGLSWQVDGNAAERDGRVLLVDLRGACPPGEFDRLLACLGWPGQPMMFQLLRPAVFLAEETFRRHALARGTRGVGKTLRPG